MRDINTVREEIPNVIEEILTYFAFDYDNPTDNILQKTILGLEQYLRQKYNLDNVLRANEYIKICDRLCEVVPLSCMYRDQTFGMKNCYYWAGAYDDGRYFSKMTHDEKAPLCSMYENAVFGFRHIFKKYKSCVIPIVHIDAEGKEGIGTGFICSDNLILTAKHCLEGAKHISLGRVDFEKYKTAKVFFHKNRNIDIAVIVTEPLDVEGFQASEQVDIFEKVITMGYPKIPGFTCFQTAEEAVVSAVPQKRFVVTEGQIAAEAQEIWSKENLFLITAKIKGGNSGGPVINQYGQCVGVVSAHPYSDSDTYDDLGYGTAVPIRFALEIIENPDDHERIGIVPFEPYPYKD